MTEATMETLELGAADRHLVQVALTNHANALEKEAKKLEQLGHMGMSDKLSAEAEHIIGHIRPAFDEQRSLNLA